MKRASAAIIGGGIAGLSAGCYLQANGYRTRILEMAGGPGGVSVSWKRGEYVFDGATNWLAGSGPALNWHALLAEVLDFSRLDIIDYSEFILIERPSGVTFRVYKDVEKLRAEMLRLGPEDRESIDEFCDAVSQVASLPLPVDKARETYSVADYLRVAMKHGPLVPFVMKWRPHTIASFAARLRSEELREVMQLIFPRHEFFSVLSLVFTLGWMCMKCAGYPMGGSARVAGLLEQRYRALGGTIDYHAAVGSVNVTNGRATGVTLRSGDSIEADLTVSAADMHATLFGMLGGRHLTVPLRTYFEQAPLYPPLIQVSLGVAQTFNGTANKLLIPLREPLRVGTTDTVHDMMVRVCSFDPGMAPAGKTALVVHLRTHDFDFWNTMRRTDPAGYAQEKSRVADAVVRTLDERFGRVKHTLETLDVATPATYFRYTGVHRGSYQGWAPTPHAVGRSLSKTIPGLRDFYMTGQWLEPAGGIPRAIISSRNLAQVLCREDSKRFAPCG
jgi:phytoene dehydrogenase-like protein